MNSNRLFVGNNHVNVFCTRNYVRLSFSLWICSSVCCHCVLFSFLGCELTWTDYGVLMAQDLTVLHNRLVAVCA
ncbi:hypothetical protein L1987_37233 [Smallanthus sonchifolius]|uniref:Uncharacterized protein n=1 Tax=Smallanthus sonchifolius TaxID=185202 RepID=A0ACB9HGF9_9ASTR|nr:hypothetical protein L1987_37233 [Smallanthus sonchifolius]